ncbi:MAG: chemotaxis protein CheX [Desulfuromonadaceae bacterium]|nr:chemotaxis protein CheX [Desulfuromonadaceae bacterium]
MDLQQEITKATTEIFETMIMVDITPGDPLTDHIKSFKCSVSGVIGMAGDCKAMLSIHAPENVAMSITSSFLGMDVDEVNDDVTDAIGELANMLAGNIKMVLGASGKNVTLSIPSCIHGEEYSLDTVSDADWVIVPFTIDAGQFLVEFQVKNS